MKSMSVPLPGFEADAWILPSFSRMNSMPANSLTVWRSSESNAGSFLSFGSYELDACRFESPLDLSKRIGRSSDLVASFNSFDSGGTN